MKYIVFLCLIPIFIFAGDIQKPETFRPNIAPELSLTRLQGNIIIDGDLSDDGWSHAIRANNFSETEPGDQTKPPVKTEVLMTYDDTNLYVAFLCEDDPRKIRASLRDRDQIWSDDYIGLLIDTYGDASWAYFIFSNPLGVQGDTRYSSSAGEDDGFDLIFSSNGKITETGYQVEMAIPFTSLRFPDRDEQVWRVNFWRTHPRESRNTYSWAAIDRDNPCFLCQYGSLKNIKNVESGRSVELLPSLITNQTATLEDPSDPDSDFKNHDINGDASLGIKWTITPSLTVEGSYNPDFSQVESDADKIDINQPFALSFSEKRPFFLEGSDLFSTWVDVVYTRSINDPVAAGKVIGRWRRSTLAFLTAVDETTPLILPFEERSSFVPMERSVSNILRFKQTFLEDSYLGTIITDRRYDGGGSGTTIGIDGSLRLLDNYRLEVQAVTSRTAEPNDTSRTSELNGIRFDDGNYSASFDGEEYNGNAVYASFERDARHWNFDIDFRQTSPTFRADNGFVTSSNRRQASVWNGYTFYFDNKYLNRINPSVSTGRVWNYDGIIKDEWINPSLSFRFKKQTFFSVAYLFNSERFKDKLFSDINRFEMEFDTDFSDPLHLGFWLQTGRMIANRFDDDPVKGRGTNFEFWGTIKPAQRWIIEPAVRFSDMYRLDNDEKVFSGYIFRLRNNLQFTRELFLRLVFQYNDFNSRFSVEPLLSYKLNPFTIFYMGSSHNYRDYTEAGWEQTSRQFFMKFQYLFSI
ncbi:MAG: DUF5916 domain-containing protein [Calditrichaceae bacterium]